MDRQSSSAAAGQERTSIRDLRADERRLEVLWEDGHRSSFALVWLRDSCGCAACRDPGTGQRFLDLGSVPEHLAPSGAALDAEGRLAISWGDHESVYEPRWLRGQCASETERRRRRPRPRLWGAELGHSLPTFEYADVVAAPAQRYRWLAAVRDLGVARLRGVPLERGTVCRVGSLAGFVRETNYGRSFDVVSRPDAENLAYTALALEVHTDNPYRDPVPGYQLLHCRAVAPGGGTILVDGCRAASVLRREDEAAFDLLCRIPRRFRYADDRADLRAAGPVLITGPEGAVRGVRWNERSAAAPEAVEAEVEAWYRAARAFAAILARPELRAALRLEPGDLLLFDNQRVLHGRAAFDSSAGTRHLEGCYVDSDGVESTLRVLARQLALDLDDAARPGADLGAAIDAVLALYRARGARAYLGEPVSIAEHVLQAAEIAERAGAPSRLVAAALLHDVGHLLHELPEDCAESGVDSRHEEVGARFLAEHFPAEVVEPVRLHVAAKRYLCAVDPGYHARLSPASVLSLGLQGGAMSDGEAQSFARLPFAADAVLVRGWEEAAKSRGRATPDFEHFRRHLEAAGEEP